MNSILYHQKQKQDSCGRRIYIGEDAYPYADQDIIVVADGLGGRGGYPHTKINKKILDRDLFYNIVFAPVFGAAVSMDFQNFVVNSFSEIFDTKDYYFENSATTRSSGYFASRLVTAITLFELKYNPYFNKALIFSRVRSATPAEKGNIVQAYGDKLAQLIRDKLSQIAANVGFEVETKISGAYLLPSTLTATLVDDCGDHVDTIYFWAGDSRGYSWDEKGLAQVIGRVKLSMMEHAVDEEVERLGKILFSKDMLPETKAYIAHNYLVKTVKYWLKEEANPLEKSYMQSAYGALINHKCVCQGYAEAYKRFMDSQGVICYVICGKIRGSQEYHAWNVISFDGRKFYHVDVTWDVSDSARASWKYFCKSDAQMSPTRIWTRKSGVICASEDDILSIALRQISSKRLTYRSQGIDSKYF